MSIPINTIPLTEQLACARRELGLRRVVYPRRVAARQMTQDQATREERRMAAIVETLQRLVDADTGEQMGLWEEGG